MSPQPEVPVPEVPRRVVVLAGGTSRRLGRDKLTADLGGTGVLDHLLVGLERALPGVPVVLVGVPLPHLAQRRWVREEPAGGGPVAGIAAGLVWSEPGGADLGENDLGGTDLGGTDLVAVVAGDQPFAAPVLPTLLAVLGSDDAAEAALAVDEHGRDQPLLAVYRVGPLRRAIGPAPDGARVRDVVATLRVRRVVVPALAALDVDTEQDLARASRAVTQGGE